MLEQFFFPVVENFCSQIIFFCIYILIFSQLLYRKSLVCMVKMLSLILFPFTFEDITDLKNSHLACTLKYKRKQVDQKFLFLFLNFKFFPIPFLREIVS